MKRVFVVATAAMFVVLGYVATTDGKPVLSNNRNGRSGCKRRQRLQSRDLTATRHSGQFNSMPGNSRYKQRSGEFRPAPRTGYHNTLFRGDSFYMPKLAL